MYLTVQFPEFKGRVCICISISISFFFQGPQQNGWLVVLKKFLDTKLRLAWSLKSSCPCLWSTGITRPVTLWLPEELFKHDDYCEKQVCPRLMEAGGTLCYAHPSACSAGSMEASLCSSLVNMLEIHATLPSMAQRKCDFAQMGQPGWEYGWRGAGMGVWMERGREGSMDGEGQG